MNYSFEKITTDMSENAVLGILLCATLFLALVVALNIESLTSDTSLDDRRFIVMPRNCYLKIP